MDKGTFKLINFYERRVRRIIPALLFIMLCTLPFAWFIMMPQDLKEFSYFGWNSKKPMSLLIAFLIMTDIQKLFKKDENEVKEEGQEEKREE